jgi:hypothetical protein
MKEGTAALLRYNEIRRLEIEWVNALYDELLRYRPPIEAFLPYNPSPSMLSDSLQRRRAAGMRAIEIYSPDPSLRNL